MLTPEQAVVVAIAACVAGAALTLLVSHFKTLAGWLAFLVTSATAVLISSAVLAVLTRGPSPHPAVFWNVGKFGFALRFYVDGLTAVFLLLAAVIAVPAAFYSISYMRHYRDYGVGRYYPYFLLFLAAMYGLLSTTDMMWFFFIFWQLMTLPGYALIRYEHRKRENVWAANKYLIMMEIACAATMIGAELLAVMGKVATGSASLKYDFDTVSANLPLMLVARPGLTALAFGLFLIGFGIKMGMWPFGQIWLPDAHPAAPSPVSAMLSGVMIKTGVYGLMRYFLWLVPVSAQAEYPLARWGMLVAVLGTITLFTGTMQALKQEQSKRLLAFHSIGQIGYILLGTGTCMALLAAGTSFAVGLATIGLFGALFHVLNHGLFKGLLFLNAGSMLHATGTQDLNKMGGMMKYMPLTAVTALVASFSISGVPLFNGFVSKWSIYVAAIQGTASAHYLAVCAVLAILTSALTLASFIKFFGVSFLSRTSDLVKARAAESDGHLEVPWMMQLPQLALACLCVLLGIVPALGFQFMGRALQASRGGLGTALAGAAPIAHWPLAGVLETQPASSVPLSDGLAGKWSIFAAAILSSGSMHYLAVCAVVAIVASALALAAFIKFFGVSFLSPRDLVKARGAESKAGRKGLWMRQLPRFGLAGLCLLIGIVPAIGYGLIQRGLEATGGHLGTALAGAFPIAHRPLTGVAEPQSAAVFAPLAVAAALALMFLLGFLIARLGRAPRRVADPWLCGYSREAEVYRYVAHNFYGEIKRYFRWLGGMPRAHGHKAPVVRGMS